MYVKNIGGLDVRNLQAINHSLILSAGWRLAKDPQSQIAHILKEKNHHDSVKLHAPTTISKDRSDGKGQRNPHIM